MGKNRNRNWLGLVAAGAMAVLMAGCGGGSDGAAGPQGSKGDTGDTGATGPTGPAGTGSVNLAAITPEAWESANFKAAVASVNIASPPVVEFTLTDGGGNPVVGFESLTSKSSTATVTSYPNISFAIAKLVPRTDATPSSWVSYMVTSPATTTCAKKLPARPGTDNTGTLVAVAGKPGTYQYTFWRDITTIKDEVAALDERPTSSTDPCYERRSGAAQYPAPTKADLGDLTYAPALPHRLTIQISGAARGTGTNTSNGVASSPPVDMANPVNVTYDFKPGAAGAPGTPIPLAELTREDVNIDTCNVCHGKLAIHGATPSRTEVRYCVVCHTDQRAYGYANTASSGGKAVPTLTETKTQNALTGITSYSYSPETRIVDGEVSGNFNTMIHKIHQGKELVKENYHYAGIVFDNKGFSKLGGGQRMCTTCHDSKVASTAENYKLLPSRTACGSCHDGIVWSTGGGSTLADKAATAYGAALASSGHGAGAIGGPQADDSMCATCHTAQIIRVSHRMENLTKNNKYILPGLATFEYQIASLAQPTSGGDVTIRFRILQRVADANGSVDGQAGTPVTFLAPAVQPQTAVILSGFEGSPSFLLAYAKTQDGITTPADFNNQGIKQGQPISVAISALLNTSAITTVQSINTVGSLSPTPDAEGYYTATIRGNGSEVCGSADSGRVKCMFPDGARMRTVALQGYFTQVNAPTTPQGGTGPVGRHAISVLKTVTGDAARRTIVAADKCASCHEWFEGHGGNRVYETQVCVMCHNPNLPTSGRGISDATLAAYNAQTAPNTPTNRTGAFTLDDRKILREWEMMDAGTTLLKSALAFPVTSNNFKDMIHGIHAGRERVTPFQDARDRTNSAITLLDFRRMDFPGKLNNCETCHVTATSDTKTYDFVPAGALASTYESIDATYFANYGLPSATPAMAKTALATVNANDIVVTPYAASCVSCHDRQAAKAHIAINGGAVNLQRSVAQPAGRPLEDVESCVVCHGPGRDFDTSKVHK